MSLKKQALAGMIWTYSQQFGTQTLTFGVSVVLARILLPEEFGLIGMLAIFIGIGNTLFEGGMTSSLIRTNELNEEDYSTVFFFNLGSSIIIYGILFLCAPFIANFYNQPTLNPLIRVYGLTFIISAFGTVQNTILTRELKFKKQALITFPALLIGGIVAIAMAYKNFGVWSLVGLAITNAFFTSLFLWLSSKWRPIFVFNKKKFHQHFHYGYKLTVSGILDIVFTNIYQIIIGRFYTAALVGYYARANSLMMLPVSNVSGALNRVIFPIFSKVQNDISLLKNTYKKVMQLVLFVVTPIMVIMVVLAKPIIILLFTEKWLPMVTILQIICASGVLYPIHLYNLIVLQVKGRSDLFLKLEIIKKVIIAIVLVITLYFGFYALLWGQLICSILALFINTHYAGKMLNYSGFSQIRDIFPIFIFSICMGCIMYLINTILINQSNFLQLLICGALGGFTYLGLAFLFKFESINDIKNLILKK